MTNPLKIALIAALPLALSSCETFRNTFGLDHYSGDEWSVPNTQPLCMPPDHNLVPPQPGADPIHTVSPSTQAQKNLGAPGAVKSSSEGEMAIVKQGAGETQTDPNIRAKVDKEAVDDVSTLSKLTNIPKKAMENLMGGGESIPAATPEPAPAA